MPIEKAHRIHTAKSHSEWIVTYVRQWTRFACANLKREWEKEEWQERKSSQSYKGYWHYTHSDYSSPTTMLLFITHNPFACSHVLLNAKYSLTLILFSHILLYADFRPRVARQWNEYKRAKNAFKLNRFLLNDGKNRRNNTQKKKQQMKMWKTARFADLRFSDTIHCAICFGRERTQFFYYRRFAHGRCTFLQDSVCFKFVSFK